MNVPPVLDRRLPRLLHAAVSLGPALFGLIVLGLAAALIALLIHTDLWILAVVAAAFAGCSWFMFRCTWLNWRRPTPATLREACQWTAGILIMNAVFSKTLTAFLLAALGCYTLCKIRGYLARRLF